MEKVFAIAGKIILTILFMGTLFILGAMTYKHYTEQQYKESWELRLEQVENVDMPEEAPNDLDKMCCYIRNDTVFIQYDRNMPEQLAMYHFNWNE